MPALLLVVVLAVVGAWLVVVGVYVLSGLGAALLTAGVLLFACAAVVRSGIKPNG